MTLVYLKQMFPDNRTVETGEGDEKEDYGSSQGHNGRVS